MSDDLGTIKGKLQIKGTLHFHNAEGEIISSVPFTSGDVKVVTQEELNHGDNSNSGGQDRGA
jgi:hypothetical protein